MRKPVILGAVMASMLLGSMVFVGGLTSTAKAGYFAYRQYYSSWSYRPARRYYYRSYYYKPRPSYGGYRYHYCVYRPATPRYVYYYNPYRKVYWGRYDLEKQGYSMLAEKDRSADLDSIAESAFPAPGQMPPIPESDGDIRIDHPSRDDLPSTEAPGDLPGGP